MVTVLTAKEISQLKRIRVALETIALESICEDASDNEIRSLRRYIVEHPETDKNPTASNTSFHLALAKMSNDRFLVSMLQDLLGALSRVEQIVSIETQRSWQNYHEEILSALAARNLDRAVEFLRKDMGRIG